MADLLPPSNRKLAEKIASAKEHLKHCKGDVGGLPCYECVAKRALLKKHKAKE